MKVVNVDIRATGFINPRESPWYIVTNPLVTVNEFDDITIPVFCTITSLEFGTGISAGGGSNHIYGTYFPVGGTVGFYQEGVLYATPTFTIDSSTQISFTNPPLPVGTYDVVVSAPYITSTGGNRAYTAT